MSAPTVPTMRYHPVEPSRLIETVEDLAALDAAWRDHPYADEERAAWQVAQAVTAAPDDAPTPQPRKR